MVKKIIIFAVIIAIALAIVLGGVLLYNSLKEKESSWGASLDEKEKPEIESGGEAQLLGEENETLTNLTTKGTGGGGGGGSSDGSSNGGTNGGGEIEYTNQVICQNAQNNGLCGGLDITYGEGYRTACCSEQNLCC